MTQSGEIINVCRDKLCKWVKPCANGHMDRILHSPSKLRSGFQIKGLLTLARNAQ